jgi:hypothetical protein
MFIFTIQGTVWHGKDFLILKSKKMTYYEKALSAYFRKCQRELKTPQQPSESLTLIGRKYVHLYNNYGLIAKYNFKKRAFASMN